MIAPQPTRSRRRQIGRMIALPLLALSLLAAFISTASAQTTTRDSGITVTVQELDGVTVHTLTAPEAVFANSTHIIETENSLVAIDTQFLLPNALDMRAYADDLGKPIDRVFITHEHPDHFLGSEAFADVPVYALQEVVDAIAANGQAEIDEKQGDFGTEAIASTFVTPRAVSPGTITVDDVTIALETVVNAEAETQLVIKLPDYGVVAVGDIVYSGVHLIMAGPADTWTVALQDLAATGDDYPIILAGHGVPADPSVYDTNIAWLAKAGELIGSVDNADDFRNGLIEAFPELGMPAAIDFVVPFLFPEPEPEAESEADADEAAADEEPAAEEELAFTGAETTYLAVAGAALIASGGAVLALGRRRSER